MLAGFKLHPVEINLADLADETVGLLEVLAEEKRQTIHIDGEPFHNHNGRSDNPETGPCQSGSQRREVFAREWQNSDYAFERPNRMRLSKCKDSGPGIAH